MGVVMRAIGDIEAMRTWLDSEIGLVGVVMFSVETEVRSRSITALRLTPARERQIGLVRWRDKPCKPALDASLDALDDLRRVLERRRPRHT